MYSSKERGIALITTMLVMALMSALLVGFTAVVMSDQRYRFIDRNRGQSFYAAAGGIEKLTADLGNLFFSNVAPTGDQVTALVATTKKPHIDGVTFDAPQAAQTMATSSLKTGCVNDTTVTPNVVRVIKTVGGNGYALKFCANPSGNPIPTDASVIKSGPYEGLMAQQTPYQMDVTAKTDSGGETHLVRTMESVAIPVFQFGMFSDVDLSFFAGPNFNFGGRVHTNGNLFLAQGDGATLTLAGKVTAVQEVIRQRLQNNVAITVQHKGTVSMAKAANQFVPLQPDEGSVVDGLGSAINEPKWHTVSLSTYNTWLRNGRTGAKELKLPLLTVGGSNPDLIRRPPAGEDAANNVLYNERLYTKASIRILLSDTAADIQNLPGIDTTRTPVQLDSANALGWRGAGAAPANGGGLPLYAVDATHPPIARSPGLQTAVITNGAAAGAGRTLTIAAGVPAFLRVPNTLIVTKPGTAGSPWTVTGCDGVGAIKVATTMTCAPYVSAPAHTANTAVGAGATLAVVSATIATADGPITISTPLTAQWNNGSNVITFDTTRFARDHFWVNGELVWCTGYNIGLNQLTNCTLPSTIPNNTPLTTGAHSDVGTGTIGGFLKVERQNADNTWTDITMEILGYGIGGPNLAGAVGCPGTFNNPDDFPDLGVSDPTPNAILRLQRLRDNNSATCTYPNTAIVAGLPVVWPVSTDYQPNVLFDPREGLVRDAAPAGAALPAGAGFAVPLGGVMHYITLDVANLAQWFGAVAPYTGALAGTGSTAKRDNGGFTVYFSDRRNNRTAANAETAEYGWEDFVNPNTAGVPDTLLNGGEDVNASTLLDTYGSIPAYNGVSGTVPPCNAPCVAAPLTAAARPVTTMVTRPEAQVNRAILFRRALKLTNASQIRGFGVTGLTIASENPVYVQGDWNTTNQFNDVHAATSIIADAVTLLSSAWNDTNSFLQPYNQAHALRARAANSWYRMAIIGGKGPAFPQPNGTATDFGTDGGAHNFLRYLEGSGGTVNYRGSIATFFFNRQAVGTYKCCATVYNAPTRAYAFDIEFLQPSLLPPNTPVFRDMNAVGFAQEMRPGR